MMFRYDGVSPRILGVFRPSFLLPLCLHYFQINKKDFWESMGVHPSAFSNKIFEMIDSDASGM